MFGLLKKIALYLIPILGIIYGYQFMTGKSIDTLPGEIVGKIQQKNTAPDQKDPEKNLLKNQ